MIESHICRGSAFPGECRDTDEGLNWGPDISDVLLSTEEAAEERGRVEIDAAYTNRNDVDIKVPSTEFIQPGGVVAVHDGVSESFGILRNIQISVSKTQRDISISSSFRLECNI